MPTNISLLLQCTTATCQSAQAILYLCQSFGLSTEILLKSPDFHLLNSDQITEDFSPLTIEQVRDLQTELTMHPYQGIGPHKLAIFVICKIELASLPAQNALLKALEEPPAQVKLILTTAQPQLVLPTILSRCQLVELSSVDGTSPTVATNFQVDLGKLSSATYTDLMSIADQYKEKNEAQQFLTNLTVQLHQAIQVGPSGRLTNLLQQTIVANSHLRKNVNTKLVLEELLFQFKAV